MESSWQAATSSALVIFGPIPTLCNLYSINVQRRHNLKLALYCFRKYVSNSCTQDAAYEATFQAYASKSMSITYSISH